MTEDPPSTNLYATTPYDDASAALRNQSGLPAWVEPTAEGDYVIKVYLPLARHLIVEDAVHGSLPSNRSEFSGRWRVQSRDAYGPHPSSEATESPVAERDLASGVVAAVKRHLTQLDAQATIT